MARSAGLSLLILLVAASAVHAASKVPKLKLSLAEQPKRTPSLVFNDAWVAKIYGTDAGTNYRPDLVDWASVISSIRTVCQYEMRICNWCTRACFHDGGSNALDEVGATIGIKKNTLVTAPPGGGGLDASLLLTNETLRAENSYDSFSTFVAAVIRTLVGFYDISYADGLAVCGATAREMLTYGQTPVQTMMPAVDKTFPIKKEKSQDFLVGRLDQNVPNPENLLPGQFTTQEFVDWFEKHFARGAYDGVALLGSHSLLDNQGCVKSSDTKGLFYGVKRMFAWNAPNTYYQELATTELSGPIPDMNSKGNYRTDPMPHPVGIIESERCKFTSTSFQDAAATSVAAVLAAGMPSAPEPSFEWIDKSMMFPADKPGDVPITGPGRRRLLVSKKKAAAAAAAAATTTTGAADPAAGTTTTTTGTTTTGAADVKGTGAVDPAAGSAAAAAAAAARGTGVDAGATGTTITAGAADPAAGTTATGGVVDPAGTGAVIDPAIGLKVPAVNPATGQPLRDAGYRTRRTCDAEGFCYDGWPYTQNDGFMGQSAQNLSLSSPADIKVRAAVYAFQNKDTFNAAYGHAFVRLLNNGAQFTTAGPSKGRGYAITGWECSAWVSGDGLNRAKNLVCNVGCRLKGGCPNMQMKLAGNPKDMNCRCSTAPWGDAAKQSLFPNSTQTAFGGIKATPSGLVTGRKLLVSSHHHHSHLLSGDGGSDGGGKPKCPFATLRERGLLRGLF